MLATQDEQQVAIICGDRHITYGELERRSNQLAHYLHHSGIPRDALVGVFFNRSLEIVIAILGILKSGRAYVPLDPHYPSDRLEFIAQETQFSVLLTQQDLRDHCPHAFQTSTLCLDSEWDAIATHPDDSLDVTVSPDHIAYVMYTSGSTGKPKGVKMPRANIVRYVTALSGIIPVQGSDIYLHVASFSFSSSVRQLLLPLHNGATIILATREQTKNPLNLLHLMQQRKVTIFDGVPSVWRYALQLIDDSPERQWTGADFSLKYVALSGEVTPALLLQRIKQFLGDRVRFFNVYGQTETIGNTAYAIPQDFEQDSGYVPVGYPYPHNQAYILDPEMNPVPEGEAGELYLAGGCLAQGYMNRDDLTSEKFIQNPWANGPDRIFNTGDIARRQPNGSIELLGRTDFQVKIRGMRVELDEISAVLDQHPDVKVSATAAHESPTGETVVVGYVVRYSTEDLGNQWKNPLRQFLGEHLPDYMVPSIFVPLDELPKTPSGKLDRKSLPKPSSLEVRSPSDIQASNAVQKIFCTAFNISSVSSEDTFVNLGGHSLLYIQFSIELERHLGHLPTDWENMTVAQLEQEEYEDRSSSPSIETTLAIRALAILAIVLNHSKLIPAGFIQGGAIVLVLIAGLNFARFQTNNLFNGRQNPILRSMLFSLIIPYFIFDSLFQIYTKNFIPSTFLMVSNFFTPYGTGFLPSWFVNVYAQCIVVMMLLFAVPYFRQLAQRRTWNVSIGLLAIAAVVGYVSSHIWNDSPLMLVLPQMYLWIFILGWTIQFTQSRNHKILVTSILVFLTLVVNAVFVLPSQYVLFLVCGTLIIWRKTVPMSRTLIIPIEILGASSFYIYLSHFGSFHLAEKLGISTPIVDVIFGITIGVVLWKSVQWGQTYFSRQKVDTITVG
jgi:amino acid adenylation domain-containing protein